MCIRDSSNCSLTEVQNNLAKELLRTITVTVPLVLPDYQPMLLSQRNSKTHSFLNKLRYSPETELINNFDKGHNSVLIAKIQHFVSITNINNDVMALWTHLAEVLSNLEHFPSTQQNENEIAYEHKANENLIEQQISFLNVQNHKKSYSKTTFRIIFTFFRYKNK